MSIWVQLPDAMGGARLGPIPPAGGTLGSAATDHAQLPEAFGLRAAHARLWRDAERRWWIEADGPAQVCALGDAQPKALRHARLVAPGDRYTFGALAEVRFAVGASALPRVAGSYGRRVLAELGLRAKATAATLAPVRLAAEGWRFLKAGGWRSPAFLVTVAALSLGGGGAFASWKGKLRAQAAQQHSDEALARCHDSLARGQAEPDGPSDMAGWAALAIGRPDLRATLSTPALRAAFSAELQRIFAAAPITGWRPRAGSPGRHLLPTLTEAGVDEASATALAWWAHDPLDPLVRATDGSLHAARADADPHQTRCLRGPWRLDRTTAEALGLRTHLDAALRSDHPALLPGMPADDRATLLAQALRLSKEALPGVEPSQTQLARVGPTTCVTSAEADARDARARVAHRLARIVAADASGLPRSGEPDALGSRLGRLIALGIHAPPAAASTRQTWAALNARDPALAAWWSSQLGAALARRVGWPCAAMLEGAPLEAELWGPPPRLDACGAISALASASHP